MPSADARAAAGWVAVGWHGGQLRVCIKLRENLMLAQHCVNVWCRFESMGGRMVSAAYLRQMSVRVPPL